MEQKRMLVHCKNCKHRGKLLNSDYPYGNNVVYPKNSDCPYYVKEYPSMNYFPHDDWYCANGERKET